MRTLHLPAEVHVPTAVIDPVPLLDDEFDRYDPLQAYGEGFAGQTAALHAEPADPEAE